VINTSFAYIDFFDVESATKALRAPDKHTMDGRKLRLEYAGEAATKKATPWLLRQERKEAEAAANNESNDEPANLGNGGESNEGNFNEQEKNERLARKQERMERRKNAPAKEGRTNATSGEVLANVQRQKITAQPFKGTKITFD
jgi:RNA recognition motif-containing protein